MRDRSRELREEATRRVENRVAEQRAMVTDLATRGQRAGAQLIDSFLALATLLVSIPISLVIPFASALGISLFVGYLLLADGLPNGQSIGKRALGIEVVGLRSRTSCNYGQSFLRNLPLLLLGVFDWLFIFGRMRQCLGDLVAKTIVMRSRRASGQ